jgi:hypothetical protein
VSQSLLFAAVPSEQIDWHLALRTHGSSGKLCLILN